MGYDQEAAKLIASLKAIVEAVKKHGAGTATVMAILVELMNATTLVNFLKDLPADQRDEFAAALWDQSIGTEENALVNKVGFLQGEALEQVSDGLKAAFVAYQNAKVKVLTV